MTTLEDIGAANILKEMKEVMLVSYGYKQCQDRLLLLCNKVFQLLILGEKKKATEAILLELLAANSSDDEEKALLLNLMTAFSKKVEAYSSSTEQSYVESTLMPWLESYFDDIPSVTRASCHGLLEPLSKQPALLYHCLGQYTSTFKMMIQDDGCYAFIQLTSFRGIRCLSDLMMIPVIMPFYNQLKTIIVDTKRKIEMTMLKEVLPGPLSLSPVPCSWLRPSFEYPQVTENEKRQKINK